MINLTLKTTKEKFIEYGTFCLDGGWVSDIENHDQVSQIIDEFDANNGVLVHGNTGSGKSLIFRMLQKITNPKADNFFLFVKCSDIVSEFNIRGHDIFKRYNGKNVCFDDLGTEDKGIHFGDKVEVMEKFIANRYDQFAYEKKITYFTTNLTAKEIELRYDLRSMSRLKEMCSFIVLGGKSDYSDRRKLKNLIGLPQVFHEKLKTEADIIWEKDYAEFKEKYKNLPFKKNEAGIGSLLKRIIGTDKKKKHDTHR